MDFDFSASPPQLTNIDHPQTAFNVLWLQCRRFKTEITDLKEKLNVNPNNSSAPPSSTKPFKREEKTSNPWRNKKPGAVIGHTGHGRQLLPLEQVDEIIPCYPQATCAKCHAAVKTLSTYSRKQVCDLPKGKLHVKEYQLHHGRCTACKKRCSSELPEGVPKSLLGHFALARISLITGKYHLSKRLTAQLLQDLFGLKLSIGTVSNAEAKVTEALAQSMEEIKKEVQAADRLHADETSFFNQHKLNWLWVATCETATLFKLFLKRDAESAKKLIGESYQGVVCTDRYSSYHWLKDEQHQYCWAHIIRDFRKISERENPKEAFIGGVLLSQAESIIGYWNKLNENRDEKFNIMYRVFLKEYPGRLQTTLQKGIALTGTKTAKFCHYFLKHWDCLWHFLVKPNVDATNNSAERALRPAVIWRKICYSVQSARGVLFVERIFSVVETCRQRNVSALNFLENVLSV